MSRPTAGTILLAVTGEVIDPDELAGELARRRFSVSEADSIPDATTRLLTERNIDAFVVSLSSTPEHTWNLIERIRKEVDLATLPVMIVGRRFSDIDAARAEALRTGYVAIPVDVEEIAARVERVIRKGQRRRLRPVPVVMLTDVCEIRGLLYVDAETPRFSDAWETVVADPRSFVPVTRARVTTLESQRVIGSPDFIEVPKAQLRAVFPVGPTGDNGASRAPTTAEAMARLESLAIRLAKNLATERNVSVEAVLTEMGDDQQ